MPSINWTEATKTPLETLYIVSKASWSTLLLTLARIFRQRSSGRLSLRNSIAREWLGTTFVTNSKILYSEPSKHSVQRVETSEFTAFAIPDTSTNKLKDADAVVIFCHGGGMMIGHPLQYLTSYQRWAEKARMRNLEIVFLALKYPLSPTAKWPAQRNALLSLYRWTVSQSVSPSQIVLAGDSAGCDLIYLTLMYMRDLERSMPQPSCVISQSPWLDWTGKETTGTPRWHNDFMFYYDALVAYLNDTLRPTSLPFDTPEISAVLAEDVGRLPPQLVMYSPDEILATDSTRWAQRSRKAGVEITEHAPPGQMHTYAVGWPICGSKMEEESDDIMIRYIEKHIMKS